MNTAKCGPKQWTRGFRSQKSPKRPTSFRSDAHRFFCPCNFKGLYKQNALAAFAKPGTTNYMSRLRGLRPDPALHNNVNWPDAMRRARTANPSPKPFAHNPHTETASALSASAKRTIHLDYLAGHSLHVIAKRHGISMARVDAILRLQDVLHNFQLQNRLSGPLRKMAQTMNAAFPTLRPGETKDATEIPTPSEIRFQKFISIAESEPFGPVDAAHALNIAPATETLAAVEHHESPTVAARPASRGYVAPQLTGERRLFCFKHAKVGHVGVRYGASRDDRRHARRVEYQAGRAVYA